MDELTPSLHAPRFGLLLGTMTCHRCQASTPSAAVWVPGYREIDDEDDSLPACADAGLLQYVQWVDPAAQAQILARAPWLRFASTHLSDTTYLANHCQVCGSLQGDHFVFHPDGPFWPQEDVDVARLVFVPCRGPLKAVGTVGHSMWMDRVEQLAGRE